MKRPVIAAAIILLLASSGCKRVQRTFPDERTGGYTTEFAMSALEYALFIQKEIGVAQNVLFTRMVAAESIRDGKGATEGELSLVTEAVSKLDDVIQDVTYTMPAQDYETDREALLLTLGEERTVLKSYGEYLETKEGDIEDIVSDMEACYNALTGEANTFYE